MAGGRVLPAAAILWTVLLGGAFFIACGTSGANRSSASATPQASKPGTPLAKFRQEGLASYYSNRLAGRRTASGSTYRPERMTAAHRTLPFGTWVRVTRLSGDGRATGAEVVVQITDRGPFGGNKRILDVSYAAARALGMLRVGVVRVEVVAVPGP